MKKIWNWIVESKLSKDFARLIPLMIIAGVTVIPDTSRSVVFFSLGILVIMMGLSHLFRKIIFPYIDLETAWAKAMDSAVGAAIAFASISLLMGLAMLCGVMLLK